MLLWLHFVQHKHTQVWMVEENPKYSASWIQRRVMVSDQKFLLSDGCSVACEMNSVGLCPILSDQDFL